MPIKFVSSAQAAKQILSLPRNNERISPLSTQSEKKFDKMKDPYPDIYVFSVAIIF